MKKLDAIRKMALTSALALLCLGSGSVIRGAEDELVAGVANINFEQNLDEQLLQAINNDNVLLEEIVRIIAAGANVNVHNADDHSALQIAVNRGMENTVQHLINAGAYTNATLPIAEEWIRRYNDIIQNNELRQEMEALGINPYLNLAKFNRIREMILNSPDKQLLQAIENGNMDGVEHALARGAHPDATNDAGISALVIAVTADINIVQHLVNQRANIADALAFLDAVIAARAEDAVNFTNDPAAYIANKRQALVDAGLNDLDIQAIIDEISIESINEGLEQMNHVRQILLAGPQGV